jgi:hypothetical protein
MQGDVLEIERREGRTEIIIDEGLGRPQGFPLNESLIAFGTLVDAKNFSKYFIFIEYALAFHV